MSVCSIVAVILSEVSHFHVRVHHQLSESAHIVAGMLSETSHTIGMVLLGPTIIYLSLHVSSSDYVRNSTCCCIDLFRTWGPVSDISKFFFRPAELAQSQWTSSVRGVKDSQVAAYPSPSVNTTCRIADHPPIVASLFLLAVSVSYFKQTLWRCGKLWPYIGMGWLGTCLHRNCNAIGDALKATPSVPSTCLQNAILSLLIVHNIPSHQVYVAIENPSVVLSDSCLTTSSYLWNHMHAADIASHAEDFWSNVCRYMSH